MHENIGAELEHPWFLAIAALVLIVLAFELSHDFTPWFLAAGVLGIVVLVAGAFSLVGRASLHFGGAVALALIVRLMVQDGHYVGAAMAVLGIFGIAGMAFEQWQSGDQE